MSFTYLGDTLAAPPPLGTHTSNSTSSSPEPGSTTPASNLSAAPSDTANSVDITTAGGTVSFPHPHSQAFSAQGPPQYLHKRTTRSAARSSASASTPTGSSGSRHMSVDVDRSTPLGDTGMSVHAATTSTTTHSNNNNNASAHTGATTPAGLLGLTPTTTPPTGTPSLGPLAPPGILQPMLGPSTVSTTAPPSATAPSTTAANGLYGFSQLAWPTPANSAAGTGAGGGSGLEEWRHDNNMLFFGNTAPPNAASPLQILRRQPSTGSTGGFGTNSSRNDIRDRDRDLNPRDHTRDMNLRWKEERMVNGDAEYHNNVHHPHAHTTHPTHPSTHPSQHLTHPLDYEYNRYPTGIRDQDLDYSSGGGGGGSGLANGVRDPREPPVIDGYVPTRLRPQPPRLNQGPHHSLSPSPLGHQLSPHMQHGNQPQHPSQHQHQQQSSTHAHTNSHIFPHAPHAAHPSHLQPIVPVPQQQHSYGWPLQYNSIADMNGNGYREDPWATPPGAGSVNSGGGPSSTTQSVPGPEHERIRAPAKRGTSAPATVSTTIRIYPSSEERAWFSERQTCL